VLISRTQTSDDSSGGFHEVDESALHRNKSLTESGLIIDWKLYKDQAPPKIQAEAPLQEAA